MDRLQPRPEVGCTVHEPFLFLLRATAQSFADSSRGCPRKVRDPRTFRTAFVHQQELLIRGFAVAGISSFRRSDIPGYLQIPGRRTRFSFCSTKQLSAVRLTSLGGVSRPEEADVPLLTDRRDDWLGEKKENPVCRRAVSVV